MFFIAAIIALNVKKGHLIKKSQIDTRLTFNVIFTIYLISSFVRNHQAYLLQEWLRRNP
jgi:hypothetical protein